MNVFRDAAAMRAWSREQRCAGRTIGLVPTMGALHDGHTALMDGSVANNDVTVASVFVNPAQFAPHEDYDSYPRTWETDVAQAAAHGVEVIYAPKASDMYQANYATYVTVERLQDALCGVSRPHFFRGVATVVAKLFNAVEPDRAYFGQKDAQQCAIIRRMVRDLDFGIEIVELPIVRDADGLALSSRNAYLSAEERELALHLPTALQRGAALLKQGERDVERVKATVREAMDGIEVDYVELMDGDEITPLERVEGRVLLAAAGKVGKTRLIDNVVYEVN